MGLLGAAAIAVGGCASLESALQPVPPEVSVEAVRLTGLNFESVELTATIVVENPNPIGISLAGFSYDVQIEENSIVSGDQNQGIEVVANGSRAFDVPMAFTFREIQAAVSTFGEKNETPYTLFGSVDVDVPILGIRTIAVEHEGIVPIPKLPRPTVERLQLTSIGFTGADLVLSIRVNNPNVFGISVNDLGYRFAVDGRVWIEGERPGATELPPESERSIEIPFSLRLLDVGRGIVSILRDGGTVNYRFVVNSTVVPDHPLLPSIELPVDRIGSISVDS